MDGSWTGIDHEVSAHVSQAPPEDSYDILTQMGREEEEDTLNGISAGDRQLIEANSSPENDENHFVQETNVFAEFLQQSNILHAEEKHDDPAVVGMALISKFQGYAEGMAQDSALIKDQMLDEGDERADDFLSEETYWNIEHQTWDLFGRMMAARLQSSEMESEDPTPYTSDLRVREQLVVENNLFATCHVILEWLRKYAQPPTQEQSEELPDGWRFTKLAVKSNKRKAKNSISYLKNSISSKAERPVWELDPDAPTRQEASLEDEDADGELRLLQVLWAWLRKGEIQNAQQACEDAGQPWRAASLGGAEEAWDPKIDGLPAVDGDESMVDVDLISKARGNRRRELWKRMCYALSQREDINEYERAIYGLLSGDVDSVRLSMARCDVFLTTL